MNFPVPHCGGCPFLGSDPDADRCTATHPTSGSNRTLPHDVTDPRIPPPKWCALRKAPILVSLARKDKR